MNTRARILSLRARSADLNRSDFFRNQKAYEAFLNLTEQEKDVSLLIIGLGRLEEILGYLSTYYHQKSSFNGLDMSLMDIQEKTDFLAYAQDANTYALGKNILGTPRIPPKYTNLAFKKDESGLFVFKNLIRQKMREIISKNKKVYFEKAVDEE